MRRFSADLSRANSRTGLPIRRCSYVPQLGPITCQVFNTDGNKKSCNEKQVGQKSVDFASFRERQSMSPRLANKCIGLRMFLIKILLLLLRKESLCQKFKNDLLATPLLFLVVTFD